MIFAKIIDRNTVRFCPKWGKDGNGCQHSNLRLFYELNQDIAHSDGFYEYIQGSCSECPEGFMLVKSYELIANQIIVTYSQEAIPDPENTEEAEEKAAIIESIVDHEYRLLSHELGIT